MRTQSSLLLKFLMSADPAVSQQAQEQHLGLFFCCFQPKWNSTVLRVIGTTCVNPTISIQNDCWGKDLLKAIYTEIQSAEFKSSENVQVPLPMFSAIGGDERNRKDSGMSTPPWPCKNNLSAYQTRIGQQAQ